MIDERQRHELYRGVEELLGTERADTLMSLLPPVGWADVATKDDIRLVRADLRNLEERIDGRFAKVDARFEQVEARFDQFELKVQAMLHQSASELTGTLTFGLLGALFTMTSLCLGAIAFTG
jgi:hypothetical protein